MSGKTHLDPIVSPRTFEVLGVVLALMGLLFLVSALRIG